MQHVAYLDGLRGVAILMVLAVHTGQLVPGLPLPVADLTFYGVRGVQLFFIVSGLTLTLNHAAKPFRAGDFYRRRFFRIAPMFYGGALLYLLLTATTAMPLPTRDATAFDIVVTFLFLHGWSPSAINTVVPGGWSIAAEAMFYLVFPLILLLVPRRRGLAVAVAGSYLLAVATNLLLRRWLGPGAEMAFAFWLVQLPAFASGCWLATLPPREGPRPLARIALGLAVVALIVDSELRGHSNLLVAIVLLTVLTWAAGVVRPKLLEGRVLPFIGRISFSLYILQFAVLGALHPLVGPMATALGPLPALVVLFLTALLVTGALAWCSWRWIETPMIAQSRRLGARPRPA